jgi:toxin CptA
MQSAECNAECIAPDASDSCIGLHRHARVLPPPFARVVPAILFAPLSASTMSIAISAIIRPSLSLRVAQAALCAALLACAAWCGPGVAGALLLAAGFAGAFCQRRLVKLARIDISAVGQVRLTVYHQRDAQHARTGQNVQLLPGSTLWPGLLLLRLGGEAGPVVWLAVLPDSTAPDVRRRLALAARAVAGGNGREAKKIR